MSDIKGTSKEDRLSGTPENDTIIGGRGVDTVTGGTGNDRFLGTFGFGSFEQNTDIVTDFAPGDSWGFANSPSSTILAKIYSLDNDLYIDATANFFVSRLIFKDRVTIDISNVILAAKPIFESNSRWVTQIEALDPNTISPVPLELSSSNNPSEGLFHSFEEYSGRFHSFEEFNNSLDNFILPPGAFPPVSRPEPLPPYLVQVDADTIVNLQSASFLERLKAGISVEDFPLDSPDRTAFLEVLGAAEIDNFILPPGEFPPVSPPEPLPPYLVQVEEDRDISTFTPADQIGFRFPEVKTFDPQAVYNGEWVMNPDGFVGQAFTVTADFSSEQAAGTIPDWVGVSVLRDDAGLIGTAGLEPDVPGDMTALERFQSTFVFLN